MSDMKENAHVIIALYNGVVDTVYTDIPAQVAVVEYNSDSEEHPLITSLSDVLDTDVYLTNTTESVVLDNLHDIWLEISSKYNSEEI